MRIYELHGDTGTRLHRIWKSMKVRCNESSHPSYKHYGLRGIRICDEWNNSYSHFKNWAISNGYADSLELDRINVNGNYEPSNCRWVSHHEQCMNRRTNFCIRTPSGQYTLSEFCQRIGISIHTAYEWSHKRILTQKLCEKSRENVIVEGGTIQYSGEVV